MCSCSTKVPKIEGEKIDCLHRPCSRLVARGKTFCVLEVAKFDLDPHHDVNVWKAPFLWHSIALQFYPFVQKKCKKYLERWILTHLQVLLISKKCTEIDWSRENCFVFLSLIPKFQHHWINFWWNQRVHQHAFPFFFSALLQFSTPNLACTMFHHNVFAWSTQISTPHSCHLTDLELHTLTM